MQKESIVLTHPFLQGGGVEPPIKFPKRGLDRALIFRGGDLFKGRGCNFYVKNKLKSEIFDDKKY